MASIIARRARDRSGETFTEQEALHALTSDPDKFVTAAPFLFLLASLIVLAFGPERGWGAVLEGSGVWVWSPVEVRAGGRGNQVEVGKTGLHQG